MRRPSVLLLALALVAAALGGILLTPASSSPPPARPATSPASPAPGLEGRAPCAEDDRFDCATITVPLDRHHEGAGTLTLPVALTRNDDAPRGVLFFLTGGPGQPGVRFLDSAVDHYLTPQVTAAYQVVTLDQRGTGAGALDCPELQDAVGSSDYWFTPAAATRACARRLGATRALHGTDDTVHDLDLLRRALGADEVTLDGVSYGTFTAEQYARTHPEHTARVVLDSPVPQDGFRTLPLRPMRRTAAVLRDACRADDSCTTDPAADLAWLVRHGRIDGRPIDGTHLLDAMAVLSVTTVNPTFDGVPEMLHDARTGDPTVLAGFLGNVAPVPAAPIDLDAGLHMATLCGDLRFPWGDSSAPLAGRTAAVARALAHTPERTLWPYDRPTAARVLEISGCRAWPPTPPTTYAHGPLAAPTLILSGEHDLFCPLPWARRQLRLSPRGRLVVLPDEGHATQRAAVPTARDAVTDFLTGEDS